jgi:hypothetical protein
MKRGGHGRPVSLAVTAAKRFAQELFAAAVAGFEALGHHFIGWITTLGFMCVSIADVTAVALGAA